MAPSPGRGPRPSTSGAASAASVEEIRKNDILIGLNDMQPLGDNRRHRAGDARFRPDNILIGGVAVAIIDKQTGGLEPDPGLPRHGRPPQARLVSDQPRRAHDCHGPARSGEHPDLRQSWIPVLPPCIHEDWQANPSSRVIEVDPVAKKVVWMYMAESSGQPLWDFHSSFISSARRLPNGNTLINEGMHGRIFQVTPTGEIVGST